MSTAQIIYEQYKVLPKRVRKEIKLVREGKIPSKSFEDLMREMREDAK
jgi:hypothetical protein